MARGVFIYVAALCFFVFGIIDRHSGNNVSADVELVGGGIMLALGWIYEAVLERR